MSPLRLNPTEGSLDGLSTSPLSLGGRFGLPLGGALLITLILFWVMQQLIAPPDEIPRPPQSVNSVEIVEIKPKQEDSTSDQASSAAPPSAPPPPSLPSLSNISIPVQQAPSVNVSMPQPEISADVGTGQSFGDAFGGFGTAGSGSGSEGFGQGKGFKGKPLVPLSTARPQAPERACKMGIEGWIEIVYVVTGEGRVRDIKIIDADPRGVFEAATVESVSEWLYERNYVGGKPVARQVKQKIEFKNEDCAYNWS
ncbi:MAG: energy transducer TonB [Salinisphaeraceae bacterium]|nr:energy transducer TonB [Salinisphaeraceae bacterium]